jgi:hypothetical protein
VNFANGVDSANTVIVPIGAGGTVSVYTNTPSHIVVDITGYITDDSAPTSTAGLFVPVATARAYDSRVPPNAALPPSANRSVQLTGLPAPLPAVPPAASAVSINLTSVDGIGPGFLAAFPAGNPRPATSSLNYVATDPVANGALLKLSAGGALDFFANQQLQFIIDVNGYFT